MIGKKYSVDGCPVTWTELIKMASKQDEGFRQDVCLSAIKHTSVATQILRNMGHVVEYNMEASDD